MPIKKKLDIICLGRIAVDLYAEQIGSRLEDASSFAKYVGGSSGNIATGTARMGLKSSMLSRVGDEHMGRFIRETLVKEGVDVSHLKSDPERLTGLVVLGIKDKDTFPLIFFRENCADMAVNVDDFNEDFIASSKSLLITGTHLSTQTVYDTSKKALELARKNNTKTCLDIDYRPVLWGLTGKGQGEERFVADDNVTQDLQRLLPLFDLIVGTEEEFHIAGGSTDTLVALQNIRAISSATFVVKRGPLGASVIENDIPKSLDDGITGVGVRVEVMNVLGAGDAFMSGFLRGWINEEGHESSLRYANACGALVVSRHGCTPAMPTLEELDDYLSRADQVPRPDVDEHLNYLHRVSVNKPEYSDLCILAFDHRKQFFDMARDVKANPARIRPLKDLLLKAFYRGASEANLAGNGCGVLIDGTYGQDALNDITGKQHWIARPVEQPSSRPLEFDYGYDDIGSHLRDWPQSHIVKCLVFYHPDDEATLRYEQEQKVRSLHNACRVSGHQLLLELIPPQDMPQDDDAVYRSIKRFYNLGIKPEWWKLAPQSDAAWKKISAIIDERAPHCRGVVLLGLGQSMDVLGKGFKVARQYPLVKGFAVGRTIFAEPSKQWLAGNIDDAELIDSVVTNYITMISLWRGAR